MTASTNSCNASNSSITCVVVIAGWESVGAQEDGAAEATAFGEPTTTALSDVSVGVPAPLWEAAQGEAAAQEVAACKVVVQGEAARGEAIVCCVSCGQGVGPIREGGAFGAGRASPTSMQASICSGAVKR